jgi:parvulin-like peptidyl-prolyl isomerase
MKRLLLLTAIFLTACGPSQEEKEEIAIISCNIMSESRNMDGAVRIKEINAAREKMGEDAFLGLDDAIKQSFEYGLCRELVLNDPDYIDKLTATLEIELARLKAEEEEREKRAKASRIEREKQAAEREADRMEWELIRKALMANPRQVAHILLFEPTAEVIEEIQVKIDAGVEFALLAMDYSEDFGSAESGGDLGYTSGETFPEAFEKALAGLEVGQVSEPINTDAGTHFIKLLDIKK